MHLTPAIPMQQAGGAPEQDDLGLEQVPFEQVTYPL